MSTLAWAQDLLEDAADRLAGLPLPVTATPDLTAVPSHLAAGHLVITCLPPRLEVPTWSELEATWEIFLIAGGSDALAAWATLDAALFVLLERLAVEEVRPDSFTDLQGKTYPAFVITTTSHHTRSQ